MRRRVTWDDEFKLHVGEFSRSFSMFVRTSQEEIRTTLEDLWKSLLGRKAPFLFDADSDMAKLTFTNGRSVHICTNTRRFHRPGKTGKPVSATLILSGFKKEYRDPEHQLIPCDTRGTIECCYFGMGEDEAELALFYIEQVFKKRTSGSNADIRRKSRISTGRGLRRANGH